MGKTISTHNGSAANREHNIRNPRATDKQTHIDKELKHQNEVLHDEKPREAYRRIFGEALDAYNAKQTRAERQIPNYYAHIEKDAKKHPVYEMIVQIGDRNDTGIDAPVERECLKEFYAGWAARNPHLECIGAYIHADEADGTLHMHVDYVPWADGYKKGMEKQSALVKALEQQGFTKEGSRTAQIKWEARENAILEEICVRHGIEVEHPMVEGRKHLSTAEYKAWESARFALEVKEQLEEEIGELQEVADRATQAISEATTEAEATIALANDKAQELIQEASQEIDRLTVRKEALEAKNAALEADIEVKEDSLAVLDLAIKRKNAEAERQFGSSSAVNDAIKQAREKQKESLLIKFAQYLISNFPKINELWQQWQREQTRSRNKSHKKDDLYK